MKGQIQSLEVSYFVHATEDGPRIEAAMQDLLGLATEAKAEELEGHFGNKIIRVTRRVTGDEAAEAFTILASKMGPILRRLLREELAKHMDEHSAFYVRLDKQRLLEGRLELAESDPIRIRAKPRLYTAKGGAASLFERLLS